MELVHPLLHHCRRTHNDDGLVQLTRVVKAGQERDNLDSLAQTHLIANDTADLL